MSLILIVFMNRFDLLFMQEHVMKTKTKDTLETLLQIISTETQELHIKEKDANKEVLTIYFIYLLGD